MFNLEICHRGSCWPRQHLTGGQIWKLGVNVKRQRTPSDVVIVSFWFSSVTVGFAFFTPAGAKYEDKHFMTLTCHASCLNLPWQANSRLIIFFSRCNSEFSKIVGRVSHDHQNHTLPHWINLLSAGVYFRHWHPLLCDGGTDMKIITCC